MTQAPDIADALRKVLPASSPLVDHYLSQAVWDQAILESLATIDVDKLELPADVRQIVIEFIERPGVFWKFRKRAMYYLDRIEKRDANPS